MTIHPKTSGAGLGGAVGVLISATLTAAGVTVPPDLASAISGVTAALGAFLAPAPEAAS